MFIKILALYYRIKFKNLLETFKLTYCPISIITTNISKSMNHKYKPSFAIFFYNPIIMKEMLQLVEDFRINYFYALIYGVVGACAGVFGDLCFSIIKRQTGIKDYGNLIPGHGGVLDRLDSMMTVAPLIEMLLILLPVVN